MTIFENINHKKLDAFIGLMQSCIVTDRPYFTDDENEVLESNDTVMKATLCARFLIGWQNCLDACQLEPTSSFLFDADSFDQFTESRKAHNKLKRKFFRLLVRTLAPEGMTVLAEQAAKKLPLQESSILLMDHMLRYHGDDALCLEWIGEHVQHRLISPARPPAEIVDQLADWDKVSPPTRFILALASTTEHFPLAANTWGYPKQSSSHLTRLTPDKGDAVIERHAEVLDRQEAKVNRTSCWDSVIGTSKFAREIRNAKLDDGCLIGNCEERSTKLFHQLARLRNFDEVATMEIDPGDHAFVRAKQAEDPQLHILEAWNGAKTYPIEKINNYLDDYTGSVSVKTGKPSLKRFNPNTQEVAVVAYNIYPLQAFEKESTTKHPSLIKLLKAFHQVRSSSPRQKMLKALKIMQFIELKMPFYEFIDPAVHELYDQMAYLTKKERENGLTLPVSGGDQDLCLINAALNDLDLTSLLELLSDNPVMDDLTILHAIKASLRSENIRFLKEVVNAGVPIEANGVTAFIYPDPRCAIRTLAARVSTKQKVLDIRPLCEQATQK